MSNFLIDEDTDLLAAEFVLGTLDSEERANAQSLLRTDHGFIAMVRIWERRFGELHLMVEPVEPDAKILQRIKAKIAELPPREPTPDAKLLAGATREPAAPGTQRDAGQWRIARSRRRMARRPWRRPSRRMQPPPGQPSRRRRLRWRGAGRETARTAPAGRRPRGLAPAGRGSATAAVPPVAHEQPAAVEVQPEPEPRSQESVAKSDREPPLKPAIAAPAVLPKPSDKPQGQLAIRRPEIIGDVIRSRGRWRVAAAAMTLLVVGLVALLAAWKFVPDRLPAGLRPAPVLMSLGIQALPTPAPAVKRPPAPAFDE